MNAMALRIEVKQWKLTYLLSVACIIQCVRKFPQLNQLIEQGPAQTFFDNIPFHDKNYFQVVRLVMDGMRPDRPPGMEDDTWNLIQCCWEPIPSKRPTIEQIVKALTPPT